MFKCFFLFIILKISVGKFKSSGCIIFKATYIVCNIKIIVCGFESMHVSQPFDLTVFSSQNCPIYCCSSRYIELSRMCVQNRIPINVLVSCIWCLWYGCVFITGLSVNTRHHISSPVCMSCWKNYISFIASMTLPRWCVI